LLYQEKAFYSSLASPVVQSTNSRKPFVRLRERSGTCSSLWCRSRS